MDNFGNFSYNFVVGFSSAYTDGRTEIDESFLMFSENAGTVEDPKR